MPFNDDERLLSVGWLRQSLEQVTTRLTALEARVERLHTFIGSLENTQQELIHAITGLGPTLGPNDQIRIRIPGPGDPDLWPTVVDDAGVEHVVKCQADLDRIVAANPELAEIVGVARVPFPPHNNG